MTNLLRLLKHGTVLCVVLFSALEPLTSFAQGMGVLTNSSVTKEIPHVSLDGPALKFDFPEVRIGVAEYEEGPTGATVFSFAKPVKAAVDVRGGGPGTIDTDVLRLGYDESLVNAISFRADRRTAWRLLQAWPTQSEIRVRK